MDQKGYRPISHGKFMCCLVVLLAALWLGGRPWACFRVSASEPGGDALSAAAALRETARPKASIKLGVKKKVLYLGLKGYSAFMLPYTVKGGTEDDVKFTTSDRHVLKVSRKGKVIAAGIGSARIIVSKGKARAECRVTVRKPGLVRTSPPRVDLRIGETFPITTRTSPSGVKVRYASSSNEIATVSSGGLVQARRPGTAYISITANGITRKMKTVVGNSLFLPSVKTLAWNGSWPYASFSVIHTGSVKLYQSPFSNGIVVAVNAGHGTRGGSNVYTLCHPDGSPKVVGGSTAAGSYMAAAVSDGMDFPDGTPEAAATLSLALLVKDRLLLAGYDVLMIREESDQQLDNIARTVFANQYADCHIALHYDSSDYQKGAFYISVPESASYRSMQPVAGHWPEHHRLGDALIMGLRNRGIRIFSDGTMAIDLTQTSYSTIPSIDLEVGDRASDHSPAGQIPVADAIVDGVNRFFGRL